MLSTGTCISRSMDIVAHRRKPRRRLRGNCCRKQRARMAATVVKMGARAVATEAETWGYAGD
jgi:hypothetical protein